MSFRTAESTKKGADAVDSIRNLLRDLIDYAGLFPPASVTMAQAISNYDEYLRSDSDWMLGRFVVPVSRLGEFEKASAALQYRETSPCWRLSVLLGADPVADLARIHDFNAVNAESRKQMVDSTEVKVTSAEEINRISAVMPTDFFTYFEFPIERTAECVAALAECGGRAKIRTGGETADKFPAPETVVEFLRQCATAGVPFKATAGLHHPLRSVHRLTYQSDSPSAMMHGFLNVFLAAVFLRAGMDPHDAGELLEEKSAAALHFDSDGATWRDHRLSGDQIAAARDGFSVSFGSCSFTEPIDDLRSLHLL